MSSKRAFPLVAASILLVFGLGCGVSAAPVQPTIDIGAIQTLAVQTAFAEMTLNAPTFTPIPSQTFTPELPTDTPSPMPTPTNSIAGASCIPNNIPETGKVVEIVDGDTIKVMLNEKVYSIRYIGIDTPESTSQIEYYGKEASYRNAELVYGKSVTLIRDVSETDKYGRLLRYVIVDNIFVNYELVIQGFATAATYPPDISCAPAFQTAQQQASSRVVGLWAMPTQAPLPTQAAFPTQALVPASNSGSGGGNCSPSYPGVCIPPPPPDLDCPEIPFDDFTVLPPDPHNFDRDQDGIGCET